MQEAADDDQRGRLWAIDQEMPRSLDQPAPVAGVFAAAAQMPASDSVAEFGARKAAAALWLGGDVDQGGCDQALVPPSGASPNRVCDQARISMMSASAAAVRR
jgi:hypothetical protein